jgi:hypothetical protein
VDVEIELKRFMQDEEAEVKEKRFQVNINRLSGSAFTYGNFVNTLMNPTDGVLYKYDDCAL